MTKNYPSKDYYENLNYYKDMHKNGYQLIDGRKRDAKDAYDGKSTLAFAPIIKKIIVNENQIVSTPPFEIHALKITTINYFIVFATGQRGGKDYESDTFRVDPII